MSAAPRPAARPGAQPAVKAMSGRPRDPAALIPPTLDEMSKLRWVAIVSAVVSLVAIGVAVWAKLSSHFDSLTVSHLKVVPTSANPEGILVDFQDRDSEYAGTAAGVRVNMPKALAVGSTAQSGVSVTGGQYAVYANQQLNSGLQTSQVSHAVSAAGGDATYLVLNDGSSVYQPAASPTQPA